MKIIGNIFYRYLWLSFNIWLGYFYRHNRNKTVTGLHHVPNDRPVILACNHPNAFMDAIMLGSTTRRRTWFLARSDVFRKKWLAQFLSFIGIIPIYRLLEGAENLSKNDETFEKCAKMLEQNKAIIIFSEGLCIQERRLRKLKKGTARIAFGSEEKNNYALNLAIVPVGINYSAHPWKFRSTLHVNYGAPINLSDYVELYQQEKAKAMNVFTRDLEKRMAELLVVIEHPQNDELVNTIEEMLLPDYANETGVDSKNGKDTHAFSCEVANTISSAEHNVPEITARMRDAAAKYNSVLKKFKLRDLVLRPEVIGAMGIGDVLKDFVYFTLLFPIWIFGVLTNYIPYKLPYIITGKLVRLVEWHASINGTLSVFIYQFYWLLQSIVVGLLTRDWFITIGFVIAVPITGMIAQEYYVRMKKSAGKSRLIKLFRNEKAVVEELIELRTNLIADYEQLRNSFKSN